jgi:cytochrome c oxidase subunit 2
VSYDRQSALDPASADASAISHLFWFMVIVAAIVYVLVIGVFIGIIRRPRRDDEDPLSPEREESARGRIKQAVVATVAIMFVLLVYDFIVGRNMDGMTSPKMMTITLTGHQWWWQVDYEDPIPQNRVRTANEIHIPVGLPVLIKLVSHDVIHSFWVPNIAGKKDLIPGHHNEIVIRADRAGVYRSQCAEFCGIEHAKMALVVVAEPADQFGAWIARQRMPASPPRDTLAARGQLVVEASSCAMCHSVGGTRAAGGLGPDLTHLASRRTIAAGTLPNTRGNLAGWIVDPQTIKPGVHMPANALSSSDLQAVVAYLGTLQ